MRSLRSAFLLTYSRKAQLPVDGIIRVGWRAWPVHMVIDGRKSPISSRLSFSCYLDNRMAHPKLLLIQAPPGEIKGSNGGINRSIGALRGIILVFPFLFFSFLGVSALRLSLLPSNVSSLGSLALSLSLDPFSRYAFPGETEGERAKYRPKKKE